MNMTLYRFGIKRNYKLWIIFAAVITMYISVITVMYQPELKDVLNQFTEIMPGLMSAFGMANLTNSLISFLSNYLYGLLLIIFPLVFVIMLSNQIAVLLTLIITLMLYSAIITVVCCQIFFPGELEIDKFILLHLGICCLQFAMCGLCFLFSCIANETKFALTASIGVTVFFYMMQMLSTMGDKFSFLKYLTLFTLFSPDKILAGDTLYYWFMPLLLGVGTILFITSNQIFKRKDLSI